MERRIKHSNTMAAVNEFLRGGPIWGWNGCQGPTRRYGSSRAYPLEISTMILTRD